MNWKLIERNERYDVYFSNTGEWFLTDANDTPDQNDIGFLTYSEAVSEYCDWNNFLAKESGQLEFRFAA